MKHTVVVDPQPSDYRESQCAASVDSMVMAKAMAHVGDVLRLSTKRGRTALVRIVGVQPPGSIGTIRAFSRGRRWPRAPRAPSVMPSGSADTSGDSK